MVDLFTIDLKLLVHRTVKIDDPYLVNADFIAIYETLRISSKYLDLSELKIY